MKIQEEFEKLRQYLKTEEEKRLFALKREESRKIRLIQMITEASRDMLMLSNTLKNTGELVNNNIFLMVGWKLQEGQIHLDQENDRCFVFYLHRTLSLRWRGLYPSILLFYCEDKLGGALPNPNSNPWTLKLNLSILPAPGPRKSCCIQNLNKSRSKKPNMWTAFSTES